MNTNRSKLLGGVLALVVAFSGVGFAGATLTMDTTSITGSGAVTVNGAAASDLVIGSTATTGAITIGAATATAVSITDDSWSITAGGVGTLNSLTVNGTGTTAGVGQFSLGTASTPQTLNTNPGADVIGSTVNILHSAGAGDNANLYGSYSKVAITGDGDADTTLVGDAPRAYVGTIAGTTVVDEVYGSQPWAKHDGTGAITAMSGLSALVDVNADAFTASTVNAGHFHIEGASTVTGQFDGVLIETYGDVTSMDSALRVMVDSGATVAAGINVTGAMTNSLLLPDDAPMLIGTTTGTAATNISMEFDETTTGIGLMTMGSVSVPMVLNTNPGADVIGSTINILHSAGAGDNANLYGSYSKVAIQGDGDADTTLVGSAPRAYVLAGVADEVYGSQPWAKHVGTGTVQAMSGLSALLSVNDAEAFTATNSINAGHFHVKTASGAANGAITSNNFDGVMVEIYDNVTGLDSMLHLVQNGTETIESAIKIGGADFTNALEFSGAGDGVVLSAVADAADSDAYLVVDINGTKYQLPLYQGP
jgi:hypothetical protein